jgi:hypothetical protein
MKMVQLINGIGRGDWVFQNKVAAGHRVKFVLSLRSVTYAPNRSEEILHGLGLAAVTLGRTLIASRARSV